MIIWLASFPRSGNTLLRTILNKTMDIDTLSDNIPTVLSEGVRRSIGMKDITDNWENFYAHATRSDETILVKTHLPPRDNQPAIYIVRDGRKACLSYSHFHQRFTKPPYPSLRDLVLGADYYGGWAEHYRKWQGRDNTFVVRYEDLLNPSVTVLKQLAERVHHSGDIVPWVNPFTELHREEPNFFREGQAEWQGDQAWTPLVNALFFHLNGGLMVELGYATAETVVEAGEGLPEELVDFVGDVHRLLTAKKALEASCIKKERVIQGLKKACDERATLFQAMNSVHRRLVRRLNRIYRRHRYPKLGLLAHHEPMHMQSWGLPPKTDYSRFSGDWPRIALVTPSYGQGKFIARTIDSVLHQNYPALEYFVQDGASVDGTLDILKQYSDRLSGWESTSDGGQSQAINKGFTKINGELMAWLNSDDILLPGALAYVGAYFAGHPEVDVVYGHRILIDERDFEIGRWILPRHDDAILSWNDYIPQETLFWRRAIWDKVGGRIDEDFSFAMDWDLLLRFRKAGARFVCLPRFLGGFRVHDAQKTWVTIRDVGRKEMSKLRMRELGYVPLQEDILTARRPYILRHMLADVSWRVRKRLGFDGNGRLP